MRHFFTLLFLLSSFGFAEDREGISISHLIKMDNPEELFLVVETVGECETTEKELSDIVKGVMTRSSIKPVDTYTDPFLLAVIQCLPKDKTQFVYEIRASFGYFDVEREQAVTYLGGYSYVGLGAKHNIENDIKNASEDLLEDYIKANFSG